MPWALIFGKGDPCLGDFGGILGCCPNGKEWDKVCELCRFCWLKLSKVPLWGVSDSEPILKITLPLGSSCTYQDTCREVEQNIVVSNQSPVHIYEHSNMQTNIVGNLPPGGFSQPMVWSELSSPGLLKLWKELWRSLSRRWGEKWTVLVEDRYHRFERKCWRNCQEWMSHVTIIMNCVSFLHDTVHGDFTVVVGGTLFWEIVTSYLTDNDPDCEISILHPVLYICLFGTFQPAFAGKKNVLFARSFVKTSWALAYWAWVPLELLS